MDWKKEIIKAMEKFSGRYSQYTVFMDWVTCIALAIQNGCTIFQGKVWQDREKHYHNIMEKYSPLPYRLPPEHLPSPLLLTGC